jgi:hypothetical protein
MTKAEFILQDYLRAIGEKEDAQIKQAETITEMNNERDKALNAYRADETGIRVQNAFNDPVGEAAARIITRYGERLNKLADELCKAIDKIEYIDDTIRRARLEEVEQRYVELRYKEGFKPDKVIEQLKKEKKFYSDSMYTKYKLRAFDKMENVIEQTMAEYTRLFIA